MQLSSVVLLVVAASVVHSTVAAPLSVKTLPVKFFGRFDLDSSENFEEYLVAEGYGWFMRKVILMAKFTKVFEEGTKPGTFRFKNLTSKKDVEADNIVLGEEFQAEGLDSEQHMVLFTYDEAKDELKETRLQLGKDESERNNYYYRVVGDELILTMNSGDVICKHFYKRV
uniref:FABP domain-containing protein n=1 Tax=Steinernema glaseri TaxID=37863 RepID=A0A1I7YL22_9BILA